MFYQVFSDALSAALNNQDASDSFVSGEDENFKTK